MAKYAYLICPETKEAIWLGKPIRTVDADGTERTHFYHIGPAEEPYNHEKAWLNIALWKFLSEHAHKELRIAFDDGEFDAESYDYLDYDFVEDYTRDWPPDSEDLS